MTNKPIHLLLIEDNPGDACLIREFLAQEAPGAFCVDWADCLEEGLRRLVPGSVDVVLLDLSLPESRGLDTVARLLAHAPWVPAIVLTGLDDESVAVDAVRRGAQDYLIKGRIDGNLLAHALRYAIQRKEVASRLAEANARLQQANVRLEELAITDDLTGLYNRRHFFEMLKQEFQRIQRHRAPLAVVMFDIDHFKVVNDTHGHAAGDEVLVSIARLLRQEARAVDVVVRYGGEEFIILMPHTAPEEAFGAAERIRRRVAQHRIAVGELTLHVALSAGIRAIDSAGDESPDSLLRAADEALYAAKQAGRNCTKMWMETPPPLPEAHTVATAGKVLKRRRKIEM